MNTRQASFSGQPQRPSDSGVTTTAFQDAILGHLAANDPKQVEVVDLFIAVTEIEPAKPGPYIDALAGLENSGLIRYMVKPVGSGSDEQIPDQLFDLSDMGRVYVARAIEEALEHMSVSGRMAQA